MDQPLPQFWSTNSVPRAFFPRVAIGCRLSLKIDRNLSPSWAAEGGGLIRDYMIWRIFIQICGLKTYPSYRPEIAEQNCTRFVNCSVWMQRSDQFKSPQNDTASRKLDEPEFNVFTTTTTDSSASLPIFSKHALYLSRCYVFASRRK